VVLVDGVLVGIGTKNMLLAQVTDVHLGFDPDNPSEFNRKRLDQVIKDLAAMEPQPDLLLATGDLVDRGDLASYRRLANAFSQCPFPVWPIPGNHDQRDNFLTVFPHIPLVEGFIQYELQLDGLRLLLIDTLEDGRHGGAFCATRAAWLRARLTDKPDMPTAIIMHHPPVEVGIEWMNTHPEEQWVAEFAGAIAGFTNIVSIICGHVHRSISIAWRGTAVSVCASTAPQVALNLSAIDPDKPDDRPMIIADAPSYALHFWNGRELVSHFESSDEHVMLAKYDKSMQGLVRMLLAERPTEAKP
jgi:3',5'-cyclic AMP phosphodiesterase CpdA